MQRREITKAFRKDRAFKSELVTSLKQSFAAICSIVVET